MTITVDRFWRIGRRSGPLHVSPAFQGAGRFDDPEHLIAILYGAATLRTCLLEFLLPWRAAPTVAAILETIPDPTTPEEEADAQRDRVLAATPRRIPLSLYERIAVRVGAAPSLTLTDLRSLPIREKLARIFDVAHNLQSCGFTQLDRGALLSPHRHLTQSVVHGLLRNEIFAPNDGLYAESRHEGEIVCVFMGGPYQPHLIEESREYLTSEHVAVREVAMELGLSPV